VTQTNLLEEQPSGAVEKRPAEPISLSDNIDQATFVKGFENAAHRNTANIFYFGAPDRLAICDNRERLEGSVAEPLRTSGYLRAFDGFAELRACEDLPTIADFHEFNTMTEMSTYYGCDPFWKNSRFASARKPKAATGKP